MSYFMHGQQFVAARRRVEKVKEAGARTNTVNVYTKSIKNLLRSTDDVAKRHIKELFDKPDNFKARFLNNLHRIDECAFALTIGMLIAFIINPNSPGSNDVIDTIKTMCNITYFMSADSLLGTLIEKIEQLQQDRPLMNVMKGVKKR
ncbi:hypothetical protein FOA52_004176 [Chlamydomonas sp. UWO 241]|nr:hypothetical protein FOA52_004176 [Chlamydomonas sp. UWO 241]